MSVLTEPKEDFRARLASATKPMRVLVVDDSPDVAECLVMLLRYLGHFADACCSGRECLQRLEDFRPQAILLDINMPLEDGFEICRQIRRRRGFADIPIIACSAMDRWQVEEQIHDCGFSAHLVKPVSAAQIEAAIQAVHSENWPPQLAL